MTQEDDINTCMGESGDSPPASVPLLVEHDQLENHIVDSQKALDGSEINTLPKKRDPSGNSFSNSSSSDGVEIVSEEISSCRKYIAVAVLFFINLLNYMDRFTIAGVLIQIQEFFHINNAMSGLLQTVFIISYMLVAPLFGYLGDRYNRKIIMIVGMVIWSGFTLLASFVSNPDWFAVFLLLRALVGIGEASYCTIAPTLIGDMFVGQRRTQMLSVFFLAIPFGSGLGYIVGSQVALAFGGWEWSLRVTPALGVIAILLLALVCPNPSRGESEGPVKHEDANQNSYMDDLKYLSKNKSFISVTIGFTFMAFVVGSLTLWGPVFFSYSQIAIGALPPCVEGSCDYANISFVFGLITCIAGIAGIVIGAEAARRWKNRGQGNADPLVCTIGMMLSAPLLLVGVHIPLVSLNIAWVFIFFADTSLCLMWTLVGDMTLYVTEPSRRSTANAVMILVGHLFGDAGSPYLIGVIADLMISSRPDTYLDKYTSLQQSMYVALFACVIGGGGFLIASLYIVEDKAKVDRFLKGYQSSASPRTISSPAGTDDISMVMGDSPLEGGDVDGANGRPSLLKNKESEVFLINGRETVI